MKKMRTNDQIIPIWTHRLEVKGKIWADWWFLVSTSLKDIRHLGIIPCPWLKDVESNTYLNLRLPSGPRGCRRSGSGSGNQLLANHSAPNPKLYNTVLNNPWHTQCLPCTWIDVGGFSGNMLVFVVSHLPHAAFPQPNPASNGWPAEWNHGNLTLVVETTSQFYRYGVLKSYSWKGTLAHAFKKPGRKISPSETKLTKLYLGFQHNKDVENNRKETVNNLSWYRFGGTFDRQPYIWWLNIFPTKPIHSLPVGRLIISH